LYPSFWCKKIVKSLMVSEKPSWLREMCYFDSWNGQVFGDENPQINECHDYEECEQWSCNILQQVSTNLNARWLSIAREYQDICLKETLYDEICPLGNFPLFYPEYHTIPRWQKILWRHCHGTFAGISRNLCGERSCPSCFFETAPMEVVLNSCPHIGKVANVVWEIDRLFINLIIKVLKPSF
jgi:hypothetical protein